MRRRELAPWLSFVLAIGAIGADVRETPLGEAKAGAPTTDLPALPASAIPASGTLSAPAALDALSASLEARGAGEVLVLAREIYDTDPLTGLPNRAHYERTADGILRGAAQPAVALLDMNNFGPVNLGLANLRGVTEGRARADRILAIAGGALGELAQVHGVSLARLGGEEFVALGARSRVLAFTAAAQRTFSPGKVLEAAGVSARERRAIDAAAARLGRGAQPVGDFTYGVAAAEGLSAGEALKVADEALNQAKGSGGRGGIFLAESKGALRAWTPPPSQRPAVELRAPPSGRIALQIRRLEAGLEPAEKKLFREAAFLDPLTGARRYDFLSVVAGEWNRLYARGGTAALISARNLKQINDTLGHEAGDLYLRRFGEVLREELDKAALGGLDVREPVRVASKEFLLVGRDAGTVAGRVRQAVARRFAAGAMLSPAQTEFLRAEVVKNGLAPERAALIGTLRVVAQPILDRRGRADVEAALDRAFERLEERKGAEAAPR